MARYEPGPTHEPVMGFPTHPSQLAELVRDVGAYLVGAGTCDGARKLIGADAFRHAQPDFEAFAASQCAATDVVGVDLEIRGEGRELHAVFARVPGPLTLLLVCARNCRAGDRVVLRQRTAKCGLVCQETRWPFGMAEAELITRPASGLFDELGREGARGVRSRSRRPRFGVGLRWRWRRSRSQIAWFPGHQR